MTMKIGFPNNPRKNILEEIKWIGENGFDFVDLFLEEDKAVPEKINVPAVRKMLDKYKLGAVGHTAWYFPIGSPAKGLRKAAVEEAKRYFNVLHRLNVKLVTIHANWAPGMFKAEESIAFQTETLKSLVKEAKKYKLTVIYEPIDTSKDTLENVSKILNNVPGLYLLLDFGHANLFDRTPEEFIRKFHKKLKHVHMHDNNGREDQHLPLGMGNMNLDNVIKLLKRYYDGTITLEIFSRDKDYVLLSRDKLKKLLK